jgi:CubicO group peptidase (beta-lactamase class C family)
MQMWFDRGTGRGRARNGTRRRSHYRPGPSTRMGQFGVFALGSCLMLAISGCIGIALHAGEKALDAMSAPVQASLAPAAQKKVRQRVHAELEHALGQGAAGVTAIVMRDGRQLLRMDVGDIAPDAQLPVASASKWMTAALVMSVVDEGRLSLDAPISHYLPAFAGPSATTTLRELLAQTSGEGSLLDMVDIGQDPRLTLAESATQIAQRPLHDPPGAVFRYGGPGFQVAGAAVEAVTHKRWAELFDERIARPLGMTHTYWEHLPSHGVPRGQTSNPLLQGGVVTTAGDYMRFLTMLANHGSVDGRRILSAHAVDVMETAQTIGKPKAWLPRGARGRPKEYALGNWCEAWTARHACTLVSSPGALGTFPWLDRQHGLYGIFFTRERLTRVSESFIKARAAIIEAYASGP